MLGREFDFDLLAEVWGQGEEATLGALDELLRQRLIVERSGTITRDYTFTHHIIQEVAYKALPRVRRQRTHAKIGEAMARLYGSQAETMAGELAFHFRQGGQPGKALAWLEKAGDQARMRYALEEAVGYYTQALALAQEMRAGPAREAGLRCGRAEAHLLGGAFDAAREDLAQSLAFARQIADKALEVQVLLDLADCTFHQDNFAASVDAARQAAALA